MGHWPGELIHDFLVISHVLVRFVLGSIFQAILARFESLVGALGCQKVAIMLSNINAKVGIGKNRFRGRPSENNFSSWWPGGLSPLRPGEPSPGRASIPQQCTRASLGIAFASFWVLLQIFLYFWIDRKSYKDTRKTRSSKNHSKSQLSTPMVPNVSIFMDCS